MRLKTYQILNIAGLLIVLVTNYLANALPVAGMTTGELSALYPSLFTPAGFTFSIWGVIYLLLIAFAIYQSKGIFSNSEIPRNRFLYRIDVYFLVSSVANGAWIFAWHYQVVWLSMLLMLVILSSLIMIYLRLGIGHRIVSHGERFLVHMAFSIYLGWITVATIANAATLLLRYNWNGFGLSPEFWTSLMIGAATVISLILLFRRRDLFFSLVIVWALTGIIAKRMMVTEEPSLAILLTAGAGIFLIFAVIVYQAVRVYVRKVKQAPGA
ncbi:MAG: hypothetical protein ACLFPE_11705 [Bacteroidales bacterium]